MTDTYNYECIRKLRRFINNTRWLCRFMIRMEKRPIQLYGSQISLLSSSSYESDEQQKHTSKSIPRLYNSLKNKFFKNPNLILSNNKRINIRFLKLLNNTWFNSELLEKCSHAYRTVPEIFFDLKKKIINISQSASFLFYISPQ